MKPSLTPNISTRHTQILAKLFPTFYHHNSGSVLIILLPIILILTLFAMPIINGVNFTIVNSAKDKRADKQLNSLISEKTNDLSINQNSGFTCNRISKTFEPLQISYSRKLCYINDSSNKVPLINTDSFILDKTCSNLINQTSQNSTIQLRAVESKNLVSSATCSNLAPNHSQLLANISINQLLADSDLIISTGYIEIKELSIKNNLTVLSAGDIFVDKILIDPKAVKNNIFETDIISINGNVHIGEIGGSIKLKVFAGGNVFLPSGIKALDPKLERILLGRKEGLLLSMEK